MKKFLYFIIFTFGLLIAQNAFAGIILRPVFHTGLVGYWDFQEGAGNNVYDKSGKGNTGTWYGTGSHWADGKIGKGGSFNGSNDYVDCANNNGLNITATTTVVAWIKKNGTQENGYGTIWHDRATDHRNRFFVLTDGSLLAQYIIGGNDSQPTAPANSVLDNVWTHVILTYDGSEIVFWVNGIKQTPVAATGAMSSSTANKWIGLGQSSGVYNFNGIIDEVRIYNRALSASEVSRLYKLSQPKIGISRLGPIADDNPSNAAIGLVRQDCTGYSNCSTSLSAWQTYMLSGGGINWGACTQGDLTCVDKVAVAKIDGLWTSPDTTVVTIDGWTTDATRYIKIYTTAEARHDGKWNESRYRLQAANTVVLQINEPNVRIDGLQVRLTGISSGNQKTVQFGGGSASDFRISNCVVRGAGASSHDWHSGIVIYASTSPSGTIRIWNNIVYDFGKNSGKEDWGIELYDSGFTYYVYNNTTYNNKVGIGREVGTAIIKNNISYNNDDNYYGTFDSFSTNNLSGPGSDPEIPSTNARNGVRVTFVNENDDDFHLSSADSGGKNSGTNLSADSNLSFSTDIDRQNRIGQWDIGADEVSEAKINASQNTQLTSGLVGLWSFNGPDMDGDTAYDRSGQGNHGTLNPASPNGPTRTIGKLGQALSFDGVDDYVNLGTTQFINTGQPFTLVAWAFLRAYTDIYPAIFATRNDQNNIWRLGFSNTAGYGNIFFGAGSGWAQGRVQNIDNLNKWQHVVVTYNGQGASTLSNFTLYLNGQSQAVTVPSGFGSYTTGNSQIGRITPDRTDHDFNGLIDEVRIYNRALSAQEILRLYNLGR